MGPPVATHHRATTLPLEVLGAPGSSVEATIDLEKADVDAAQAAWLWVQVHNLVEAGSAEVTVNDGTPLELSAPSRGLLRPFSGEAASGLLPVEPRSLREGSNRLVFRYTRQVEDIAAVSGFRVLGAALVLGDAQTGKRVALQLPLEDPSTWRPFDASAEAIERGRRNFQEISRDGGPTCARCHAVSGADLQYYAFSNRSLVERARFHRFSRCEAEDLASYIRSLPLLPQGLPHAPPFQPGESNHGAAGAGHDAVLADDAAFSRAAWGSSGMPAELAWDWPQSVDTFRLPTGIAAPGWLRWIPRDLNPDWFTRLDGRLGRAERDLLRNGTLESAQAFMSAALDVGKDLLLREGDYQGKVEVLRFAAVRLWDWSRMFGFDRPDHGMPTQSPAYPYEVGFAFFEASLEDALPGAAEQAMAWWWAQLATYPGRGASNGRRPLNFEDVLFAADNAGLGPAHLAFLHVYGSWEESRGDLAATWGTAEGPVRLLLTPLRRVPADAREALLRRFLKQEAQFLTAGGTLDSGHHAKLAEAWSRGCAALSAAQKKSLRDLAPAEVRGDLIACP